MASKPPAKEGRFARHHRMAREIYAQPSSLIGHIRSAFVSVWIARGAGFYGLGWICAFIVLEVRMFGGELIESDSIAEFAGSQLIEYVLRVGVMSFLNSFLAMLWPAYVLEKLDVYAIPLLIAGYFAFEKLLRPLVENRFPELRDAREAVAAKKQAKRERRTRKRQQNRD